jgi:transposase-like protein
VEKGTTLMTSGRTPVDVDIAAVLDALERGASVPQISIELGISAPTLRKRITDLQVKQGLLLQYRAIQSLHLTELQARVLEAITPEKINEAPLRDLIASYKILKEKELTLEGKPSEIKGLVAHLIHIEKQEQALLTGQPLNDGLVEDAKYDDLTNEEDGANSLSSIDNEEF